MPTSQSIISPFKLLRSYDKKDGKYFFGRDKETRQLYEVLRRSKFMMIYGASGTGKTSLVQCGLQNMYSSRDWLPIIIRRNNGFLRSIREKLEEVYQIRFEIYRAQQKEWYPDKEEPKPELESFISIRELIKGIFAIAYVPVYLILDQFEEIFTQGSKKDQQDFFKMLEELSLFSEDLFCKFIIITREEFIANFYEYEKRLPFLFENRFRVEKMREDQLEEVIEKTLKAPYEGYPKFIVEENIEQKIRKNLSDKRGEVGLSTMQVYLDHLYKQDLRRREARDTILIDSDLVETNYLDNVLNNFLDNQARFVASKLYGTKEFYTHEEINAPLSVLFQMVTREGAKRHRNVQEIFDEIAKGKYALEKEDVSLCLESFASSESRILYKFIHKPNNTENNLKDERYEIMHDTLAERVNARIGKYEINRREALTTLKTKLKRYEEVVEPAQKSEEFLSEGEIELIRQTLNTSRLDEWLDDFFQDSIDHHIEKKAQEKRRTTVALFAAAVFFLVAAVAILFYIRADRAEREALRQKTESDAIALDARAALMLEKDPTLAFNLAKAGYALYPDKSESSTFLEINSNQTYQFYQEHWEADDQIVAGAYSPNDELILTSSSENYLELRTVKGELLTEKMEGHSAPVWALAFSPDSKFMLSASSDSTIKLWNLKGEDLETYPHIGGTPSVLEFGPSHDFWALGTNQGFIQLKNPELDSIYSFQAHSEPISALLFSEDGQQLLSTSFDGSAKVWTLEGKELIKYEIKTQITSAAISPAFYPLFIGDSLGRIHLVDSLGQQKDLFESEPDGHKGPIRAIFPDRDSLGFVSVDNQAAARFWAWDGFVSQEFDLKASEDLVSVSRFSGSGKKLMLIHGGKEVWIWELEHYSGEFKKGMRGAVRSLAFSADGEKILSGNGGGDKRIRIWDKKGMLLERSDRQSAAILGLAYLANPDSLLVILADGKLKYFLSDSLKEISEKELGDPIHELSFDKEENNFLSLGETQGLRVWNKKGELLAKVEKDSSQNDSIVAAVFFADPSFILYGRADNRLMLWNWKEGTEKEVYKAIGPIRALASSPSDQTFLCACDSAHTHLRDDNPRAESKLRLPVSEYQLSSIAYFPTGKYFLLANEEGETVMYDLKGNVVQINNTHDDKITGLSFSTDGSQFLSGGNDRKAVLLKVPLGVWEENKIYRLGKDERLIYRINFAY